jgi:hypothetical protein
MLNTTPLRMDSFRPLDEWTREMRRGDWEAAWRVCDRVREQRRGREPRDPASGKWLPRHLQWIWDGTPLAGRRVLVRCYHGLGDTIQFIRFVPALRRSATHVTLWAQSQLLPLLQTVPGVDALLPLHDGACPARCDVDIEIMELAHALRVTPATLPGEVPYIHVPARRYSSAPEQRPRIGLVWQSGSWDERRSVEPELMRRLTRVAGVCWKILQRGPALSRWPDGADEKPIIRNILEEAAELRSLDLLITVDTLSAHLAGALGVRTWTLLPSPADWRWMEDREDTPWYPTMRLFRQETPGDWEPVIARVARELTLRRADLAAP